MIKFVKVLYIEPFRRRESPFDGTKNSVSITNHSKPGFCFKSVEIVSSDDMDEMSWDNPKTKDHLINKHAENGILSISRVVYFLFVATSLVERFGLSPNFCKIQIKQNLFSIGCAIAILLFLRMLHLKR